MGTTLTNGVYLPNEGERNCYAGLKTNWEILDQKVADVTALQQAVAGALHREIVESLPTTDINPNTIYMILSGTSATENVYNEYMYVNNAWELIGTSATDLTNYYTKSEVDGKLLLKANASDLTSHTGDTTIHVTTADKTSWNTVTSKANDSDVVHKSGDETIDGNKTFLDVPISFKSSTAELGVSGGNTKVIFTDKNLLNLAGITFGNYGSSKLSYCRFHIYDKDSNNQEIENFIEFSYVNNNQVAYFRPNKSNFVTLGTVNNRWNKVYADEFYYGSNNVEFSTKFVTTDTNQTISGVKTFDSNTLIYNSDNTATTPNLYLKSSKIEISSQGNTSGDQNLTYLDKNNTPYAYVKGAIQSNGSVIKIRSIAKDSSDNSVINELQLLAYTNGNKAVFPSYSNEVDLGTSNYKWKSICATNYYYGSNSVEFSTKFVTTDTNQNITGTKTFDGVDINFKSNNAEYTVANGYKDIFFLDKNSTRLAYFRQGVYANGNLSYQTFNILGYDSNNQQVSQSITFSSSNLGLSTAYLRANTDNVISLGDSTHKWSNVETNKVNNLEPSSLSLPSGNLNDVIDISSYITDFSGAANTYTAPANGWVTISINNCLGIQAYITGFFGDSRTRPTTGTIKFLMPICKNQTINLQIYGGTLENARFIPCQGNV